MGSATSKPSESTATPSEKAPVVDTLADTVASLDLSGSSSGDGTLTLRNVDEWEAAASKDPRLNLARTILSHTDIPTALLKRNTRIADAHVFNTAIEFHTGPTTNQRSSGRCWLFATTNVIRYDVAKALNLSDFELSQSYLYFWDKLNKANYFLEQSIALAHEPLDSRLVSHLSQAPLNDGGQWDMAANLLENYGVVPQAVFPESYSSSASGRLNSLLTTKVREQALFLRRLDSILRKSPPIAVLPPDARDAAVLSALRKKKDELLREVWNVLSVSLGVPPKPDEKFKWEYYDKDGKARSWEGTPVEFYKAYSSKQYPPTDSFSLINDPRNPYSALYTVDNLGNVWGGRGVQYVNTTSERLKEAVIKNIKAGQPVFFGCDVGKFSNTPLGIMDTNLFDYENAFNITFNLTKAERLQTGESAMTHAMVISAVHLDASGKPVRYKVENSWGDAVGDHGYFIMTDAWFDEFVYQVVVPKALAPKDLVNVLEGGNATVLPAWDPMGALA